MEAAPNKTVHHDEEQMKKLECTFCSYQTVRKSDLTKHIKLIHSGNSKVFEFNFCSFHTVYKQSLIKHKKIHSSAMNKG